MQKDCREAELHNRNDTALVKNDVGLEKHLTVMLKNYRGKQLTLVKRIAETDALVFKFSLGWIWKH